MNDVIVKQAQEPAVKILQIDLTEREDLANGHST